MYLTDRKVAVMGAAGAIGSNIVQDLLATGTARRIAMYDPFGPGLEGAALEILHCAFPNAEISWTTDPAEALRGAAYVISSGGAPRKEGMTREDLLLGNCQIARGLGEAIREHAPTAEYVIVIFNPADITGLTTLVYSGLRPEYVTTLAALDSTRLRAELAAAFAVMPDEVTGCATYGGHGEKMAVFADGIGVSGIPLRDLLQGATVNDRTLSQADWTALQERVRNGGSQIIKLRGRSSYQSPAHQSVAMLRARIECADYPWPCGAYFATGAYANVMMAAPVSFDVFGMAAREPVGNAIDMAALAESYQHLAALRNEVIQAGVLPPVERWPEYNPHL
ncbi:MAG: malate dehydrogenase [Chthonomonadales bacterium]|nr:malate dehydrogenase [Chthonomonadales bacterium]